MHSRLPPGPRAGRVALGIASASYSPPFLPLIRCEHGPPTRPYRPGPLPVPPGGRTRASVALAARLSRAYSPPMPLNMNEEQQRRAARFDFWLFLTVWLVIGAIAAIAILTRPS
jgi:hypothetical protein